MTQKEPAKVKPSVLRLKPGATPKRAKTRKYPLEHMDFMKKFVKNWNMLAVSLEIRTQGGLHGSKFLATIDCFKRYWQFPLSQDSQE
jgi:hypothetical protein